jgi:hypothetical protein
MSVRSLLKLDNYMIGGVLGILLPLITSCLVIPIGRLVIHSSKNLAFFDSNILLLCLIPGLLVMRYYIVKVHLEKTGKGLLIMTVFFMVAYFIFAHKHPFNFPF